ncbi:MAG: hypothetical protein AT718_06340 [Vulcanisaeta sp. JCHS_4]|nr:MAG: hypothetical protein AT718_06340 [Vulcanisaeta sp. JCHS_4]
MHLLYGDREFLIDLMPIQRTLMNVYKVPYELVINGHEVIIKTPLTRDAVIRPINTLTKNK